MIANSARTGVSSGPAGRVVPHRRSSRAAAKSSLPSVLCQKVDSLLGDASKVLSGPPEPTNRPLCHRQDRGIELCWAYNRQHGTRYPAVMPTNLYGPGNHYDLETSY